MTAAHSEVPAGGGEVPLASAAPHRGTGYAPNRNRLATVAILATFLFGALPGFVLGVVALVQISRRGQEGRGRAWIAVILSTLIMVAAAIAVFAPMTR